jgi:hypothetical protein
MIVPYARHWSAPERRSAEHGWHMSEIVERRTSRFRTSLVKSSLNGKLLPTVLGLVAGSVDFGFLGLGGLFTTHATGNRVITADLEGGPRS